MPTTVTGTAMTIEFTKKGQTPSTSVLPPLSSSR